MSEEKEVVTMQGETADNNQYIDAIKEMKATTVARDKYEQLQAENSKLLKSLINGESIEMPGVGKQGKTREELDSSLTKNQTLMDSIQCMVDLHDKIVEEDGIDPFNAQGQFAATTPESEARNSAVLEGLKSMLEEADGDPVYFASLYERNVR